MHLYLLKRKKGFFEYDEIDKAVVRARSEKEAREILQKNEHGFSMTSIDWTSQDCAICEVVYVYGEPGIVLAEAHEG